LEAEKSLKLKPGRSKRMMQLWQTGRLAVDIALQQLLLSVPTNTLAQ
jgi:hypothetical protein